MTNEIAKTEPLIEDFIKINPFNYWNLIIMGFNIYYKCLTNLSIALCNRFNNPCIAHYYVAKLGGIVYFC